MRLIPREEKFFDMLDRAAQNVFEGAKALKELVAHFDRPLEMQKKIEDLEHEGDILTHEIMDALNKSFITPIDREDIHTLASVLDDIIDGVQAISERMVLYQIDRPRDDVAPMIDVLLESVQQVSNAVACLHDIVRNRTRIMDYCIEIDRLENEGDRALRSALANLFKDAGIPPLEVIKWKEIYETIETATDRCEDVSDVIETVLVKGA